MKRLLLFLSIVAFSTTVFAQKGKYTIKCTVDDPSLNGAMAYLQIHRPGGIYERDSCKVSRGKFSFKGEVEGNTTADIVFDGYRQESPYLFNFVLEPGTLYVDHFHKYDFDVTLRGTPLNDALNAYLQADWADSLVLTPRERARMDTLDMIWNNEIKLPIEEQKVYRDFGDSLLRPLNARRVQRLWDLYHQNEHNLLALYAFEHLESYDSNLWRFDFVDSLLRTADSLLVNKFGYKLMLLKAAENTAVGKPYADIPGTVAVYNEEMYKWNKTSGSLKDIIDGKLAVVDFWASWCGPCRQEIRENLVPLYNKYKERGVVVVGVDVWDEVDNFFRAVAAERIKYPQLIEDSAKVAYIYGFDAIPQIILIGPDGTILARDLRGGGIEEAIVNALKKEE